MKKNPAAILTIILAVWGTTLRTRGYNSKYLVDGLLGLAEFLRGDTARYFMEILEENQGE